MILDETYSKTDIPTEAHVPPSNNVDSNVFSCSHTEVIRGYDSR